MIAGVSWFKLGWDHSSSNICEQKSTSLHSMRSRPAVDEGRGQAVSPLPLRGVPLDRNGLGQSDATLEGLPLLLEVHHFFHSQLSILCYTLHWEL